MFKKQSTNQCKQPRKFVGRLDQSLTRRPLVDMLSRARSPMPAGARVHRMCAGVRLLACLVLAGGAACKVATPAAVARPDTLRFTAALFALALGALAAVAVVSLRSSSARTVELFTLNDFDTGRVSFPSQNLANGQGIQAPVAPGGPDHSHVMWSNGFRPFNGGQKLFSIHDFDSGRVSFPEEATRGLRAVVKSTDTNIDPAGTGSDHVWQHQMSHGPVEYQDWPLEMPGVGDGLTAAAPSPAFKAPTMQLRALPEGKNHVGKKRQMALSNNLDKMQRQVQKLPAPCSCEPCCEICSRNLRGEVVRSYHPPTEVVGGGGGIARAPYPLP